MGGVGQGRVKGYAQLGGPIADVLAHLRGMFPYAAGEH